MGNLVPNHVPWLRPQSRPDMPCEHSSSRESFWHAAPGKHRCWASDRGLADGLPSRTEVASKIPLSKHSDEVGLSGAQTTVNALSAVLASPRFRIATGMDADQPCAESAANDLASLAGHISSYDERCGTHLAHLADAIGWF